MLVEQILCHSKDSDRVALQVKREGEYVRYTYFQVWKTACSAAVNLRTAGVRRGDRVALFAENSPEWVIAYLGIHLNGATVVPLDAQFGKNELVNLLSFAEVNHVITDTIHQELVRESVPNQNIYLLDDETESIFAGSEPSEFTPEEKQNDDVMSVIFTSGTTGAPKGVQLTCGNISSNIEGILKGIKITARDNILCVLPLHHAYASTAGVFSALSAGGTVTFAPSLKGAEILQTMRETGVTILPGVPRLFTLLLQGIDAKIKSAGPGTRMLFGALLFVSAAIRALCGVRLGKLFFRKIHKQLGPRFRFCVSGGARLEPVVSSRLMDMGILMLEGYGLTETSPVISFTPLNRPLPGSVGRPLHNIEVRIDQPNEQGEGEICMRGPSLMKGYLKNQDATDEVIRDGWFHTGDLGFMDLNRMIFISGRAKEIIVLPSGKNIYPEEVEQHYLKDVLISEICVLQKNDTSGNPGGLQAVIYPEMDELRARGVTKPRQRILACMAHVGANLPSYMRINDMVLADEPLPRTRLGKLRRHKVKEIAEKKKAGNDVDVPQMNDGDRELMNMPVSRKVLARLSDILKTDRELHPDHDFEIDLGMDSLTQVQVLTMLEDEFGLEVSDEQASEMRTVRSLLERLAASDVRDRGKQTNLSWGARLGEPAEKPLDERFNLSPGPVRLFLFHALRKSVGLLIRLMFRVRVSGLENMPKQGPFMICPNHQSYVDAVVLYTQLPTRIVNQLFFVSLTEIFAGPPLSWFIRPGRVIITGGAHALIETLKLSADALRRKNILCIFPEGGRSTTGDLMKPRPGAGILACEAQAPVVPVCIQGAYKTLSPVHPGFSFCRIEIKIGKPFDPPQTEKYTEEQYNQVIRQWTDSIVELKEH